METELSIALAWACTATIATFYYMSRATKFQKIAMACAVGFRHLAEGSATISMTKDGIRIRSKDDSGSLS